MKVNDIVKEARALMNQHGLCDWNVRISNAKRQLGCCNYTKKTLSFSKYLSTTEDKTPINTILHEIAHALTPGAHHGWKWRQKALEIGCNGNITSSVQLVKPKYAPICSKCGKTFGERHRRINGECPGCKSNIIWRLNK